MVKFKRVSRKLIGILGVCLIASSISVFAGESYAGYSTSVGKFNGDGYTAYQTKTVPFRAGDINSKSVGGGYKVDARLTGSGYSGSWTRNIVSGKQYIVGAVADKHIVGSRVRVHFSNNITTPVNVQVSGTWRSN